MLAFESKSSWLGTLETSPASGPEMACSTSSASSTVRVMGPSLSSDQQRVIAPVRGTRPYVGRSPVIPQRMLGLTMLPPVSLPIAKPTRPAAVAAPGPALEPDAPSSRSHGFMVCPPNQISFNARAPRLNFANNTAPAACSRFTTAAGFPALPANQNTVHRRAPQPQFRQQSPASGVQPLPPARVFFRPAIPIRLAPVGRRIPRRIQEILAAPRNAVQRPAILP